ncbi:MAG: hypothetical protein ACK4WK_11075, partial [Anaerolineae bacterium]
GPAWEDGRLALGDVMRMGTSGWTLFWIRRWLGLTTGTTWRAMQEYASQEQEMARLVWMATGTTPFITPTAAPTMEFYARLAQARSAMGRAAWGAYGSGLLRAAGSLAEPLGEIGGIVLPGIGIGGAIAGLAALLGILSWGGALAVGAPIAAAIALGGYASYASNLAHDPVRLRIALAGGGTWLERTTAQLLGMHFANNVAASMTGQGMYFANQAAARGWLERAMTPQGWAELGTAHERMEVMREYIRRLRASGGPLAPWKEEDIISFLTDIVSQSRLSPMEVGGDVISWFLSAGLRGREAISLARTLRMPVTQIPAWAGRIGGLAALNIGLMGWQQYYAPLERWGIEPRAIVENIAQGTIPQELTAWQQMMLGRMMAGGPREIWQVASIIQRPSLVSR